MAKKLTIDLKPLEDFRYNQISNHKFEFMLLNHDLKVVHSPFECKDYLQDIFWCESMKKSSELYGIKWKPGMFDITTPFFYLALNGGKEILKPRIKPLKKFLNTFEEALGITPTEIFETNDEKIIVLKFNREWTINGPMLSAYTTLIRVAGAYKDGDVLDYLIDLSNDEIKYPSYVDVEKSRLTDSAHATLPRLAALLEGKRPEHAWDKIGSMLSAHCTGIMGYEDFPRSEIHRRA